MNKKKPRRDPEPVAFAQARDEMFSHVERKSPLKRNIDGDEVGKTAVYLLSDLSSGVTGENLYVDSGFNIVGL